MNFQPAIKWSGSKRSQADEIIKVFPKEIATYWEPFCGGASMLYRLMRSDIRCKYYYVSDKNQDLIHLWRMIRDYPVHLFEHYRKLWQELNADNNLERKKEYFAMVRDRFNRNRDPEDFLFIMRTTTNGMPRYNAVGEFNNSFHVTRNGIVPEALLNVLMDWSILLNRKDVKFFCNGYEEIAPGKHDFVYLDPPYANTKGMYYGGIDLPRFFDTIERYPCPWALSFDGRSGKEDNTYDVPKIYDEHLYIKSGNSSFKRVIGKSSDSIVYESLYLKGCKMQEETSLF